MPEPRGINIDEAASYCGLSVSGFRAWVRRGKVPGPLPGTHRWDLRAIDMALDKLSGIEQKEQIAPLDEWLSANGH
ncbi:MAG: hypothetical protein L3J67_12555 [Hyphomicrobiaceae bacterium]|nr:hypothetical protein [Hyphomicrobiaceae bacterium]